MIAVDTNVFIYALDTDEPIKQARALKFLDGLAQSSGSTVLLWQVAGEVLNNLRKSESAGRVASAQVEVHFRTFFGMFPVVIPSPVIFATYFDLRARISLPTGTPMLLAACKEAGAQHSIPKTWTPAPTTTVW